MQQCTLLHPFHLGSAKPPVALRSSDEHLLRRALTRNNSYRAVCGQRAVEPPDDHTYTPRDYTQPKSCKYILYRLGILLIYLEPGSQFERGVNRPIVGSSYVSRSRFKERY